MAWNLKNGDAQRGQQFSQFSPFRKKGFIPPDPRRQAIDTALGGAVTPGFFQQTARPQRVRPGQRPVR